MYREGDSEEDFSFISDPNNDSALVIHDAFYTSYNLSSQPRTILLTSVLYLIDVSMEGDASRLPFIVGSITLILQGMDD